MGIGLLPTLAVGVAVYLFVSGRHRAAVVPQRRAVPVAPRTAPPGVPGQPERARPPLAAVWLAVAPIRRAMEWTPAGLATVLALAIVAHHALTAAAHEVPIDLVRLRLSMVVLAAGAGFAFDDPAEDTVASSPIPRSQRRGVRLGLALGEWACGWIAVLIVASLAPGSLPTTAVTLEALGWLYTAMAVAAVTGSTATVPAMLVAYVAAHRLPTSFALIADPGGPAWDSVRDRWLAVIAAAVIIVAASNRDPARRHPRVNARRNRHAHPGA